MLVNTDKTTWLDCDKFLAYFTDNILLKSN